MAKKDLRKANNIQDVNFDFNLSEKQYEALVSIATELFFGGAKGAGKDQALDTLFLTPTGFKKNIELNVGDRICNPDGSISKILQTHPIEKKKKYVLHFRDGRKAECGADHIWYGARKHNKYQSSWNETGCTKTAKEIYAITKREKLKSKREWFRIPLPNPVKFDNIYQNNRTIEPYLLGVLLGDGCITGNNQTKISTVDQVHMLSQFSEYNFRIVDFSKYNLEKNKNLFDLFFTGTQWKTLDKNLNKLGLLGTRSATKFIPEEYKIAPKEVRLAVLQGLLDTDGSVDCSTRNVRYSSTSFQLAEDVAWLARSLGFYASVQIKKARDKVEKDGTIYHCKEGRIVFIRTYNDSQLFRLERHKDKVKSGVVRPLGLSVVDVTIEEEVEMRCISVDNPNGLYITEEFIVTHNSHLIRYASILYCLAVPGLQVYLFRRTSKQVRSNHLYGSTGYLSVLKPFIDAGVVDINQSDNRIDVFHEGKATSSIFLRHLQHESDVEIYRGCEIHFLIMDELTHFTSYQYKTLRSCVRLGLKIDYTELQKMYPFMVEGFFPRILCASNPGSAGHSWVKASWIDRLVPNVIERMPDEDGGMLRQFIPAKLEDNYHLMESDPSYKAKLIGVGGDASKAMLDGNWEIASGSALADCWDKRFNVMPPFDIPSSWVIDRGFDWGSAKPFACCYFAEASGSTATLHNGKTFTPPEGTIFMIGELYGNNPADSDPDTGGKLSARQIGARIKEYEGSVEWGHRVRAGAGDGQIFEANRAGTEECINDNLLKGYNLEIVEGDHASYINQYTEELFTRADKSKGSRKKGLELLRSYLIDAHWQEIISDTPEKNEFIPPEEAGLVFFENCKNAIRTLPTIPRDEHDPEDVNTEAPDHIYDVVRYRLASNRPKFTRLTLLGV
jgi:hypothetical protein